jgi:hypothetical protein
VFCRRRFIEKLKRDNKEVEECFFGFFKFILSNGICESEEYLNDKEEIGKKGERRK